MENREPTPLEPGTPVVCTNRMPPPLQPWLYEVYVGVVQKMKDNDVGVLPGAMSERDYCQLIDAVPVWYPSFGTDYEKISTLIPITPKEAQLSFRDKIKRFMGEESLAYYDKASCQLDLPEEERR